MSKKKTIQTKNNEYKAFYTKQPILEETNGAQMIKAWAADKEAFEKAKILRAQTLTAGRIQRLIREASSKVEEKNILTKSPGANKIQSKSPEVELD